MAILPSVMKMTVLPLGMTSDQFTRVYLWLGVIVLLGVLLAVVALYIRKRVLTRSENPPMGFTLKDLRLLHAQGQLSDEELAAAEARTLARTRTHYLGEQPKEPGESAAEPIRADAGPSEFDSSTIDPPSDEPGAENPPADPDKNGGSGPAV